MKSLSTKDGLQEMMENSSCYTADTVFYFVRACIDRSLRLIEKCELTRMSVLYNEIVSRMPSIRASGRGWRVG